jgi:ACS family D-galactonate transporter-like MFS transporter
MNATALAPGRRGGASWLWRRQLDSYPDTGPRVMYLAITVLATITLYYELYVGGSVSTLILANLHMSFTFFVLTLAFGALIGAFGSLFAGLADRFGRANLVVFGLLFTGIFVAFVIPTATDKWSYTVETFVVGFVEGMCLVATPALIRDFSPQLGRATAMGFWTSGPVVGSLIVSVVGTNTVPAIVHSTRFWTHEYTICGIAGVIVFLIALVGLRELSPRLRDQLMVSMRDRALIEARAKGIDVESMLQHPWRQLLKADVVVSSLAISIFLLIYYSAVAFLVIYMVYVFGFSVKDANGLGNWEWGLNVAAVILIGFFSDRLRVRKPFMVVGGVAAAVMTVVFLLQFGHHPSYYTMAIIVAALSFCLGVAYVPWMASFTETVEARNPALIATGLAIWGWIIRIVVFVAYLIVPLVITSVTPLVNYGATVQTYATTYKTQLAFASTHADIVATAQKIPPSVLAIAKTDAVQLANAQKFAPELAVIQANPTLFTKLAAYPDPTKIPPALQAQAIAAAGGGAKGEQILGTIAANGPAIRGVIAAGPQLTKVAPYASDLTKIAPYSAQLTALQKVPSAVFTYLKAHGAQVTKAAAGTAGQWRDWWWVCFGGMIFFLLTIPLLRGRWRPSDAKRDELAHEAMVAAELAKLDTSAA